MELPALQAITAATTLEQLNAAQIDELQQALSKLGYLLTADGILGPMTKGFWARFKADNALSEPDVIGPGSVLALQHRLSASASADDVPQQALNIVKAFEGFRSASYQDGVGVWTIGYGTTVYPDGTHVAAGQSVTDSQAAGYLADDMTATVKALAASIPYWSSMSVGQRSALISFGYNLGSGFYGSSDFNSITAALRDHRWSDVPRVMTLYSNPSDPVDHPGLLRRRIAEGDLWQGKGEYASVA